MAETLVIRLLQTPYAACEWLIVDAAGNPAGKPEVGELANAAEQRAGRRVVALVPATQGLRTRVAIPLKGANRIRQALPFALEEQLAREVESQHFAFGKRDADGLIPVAVIAIELMDHWLQLLRETGLSPDAMYIESDGMIPVPSTITVLVDRDRAVICDDKGETTAADVSMLSSMLELMLDARAVEDDSAEQEPVNLLLYTTQHELEHYGEQWKAWQQRAADMDIHILPDGSLPRLAARTEHGINLLQGPYAPRSELAVQWRPWKNAAALAAICISLLLVLEGARLWQLSQLENQLDQSASSLLQSTFGNTGPVNDPWTQLRSRLELSNDQSPADPSDFADALETLAIAFAATPGLRIETLSYRQSNIDIQLRADDVETLDQLRQRIIGPGRFAAEIQSANPDENSIRGRMKISARDDV